ncbi:GGDEF domain-containing protein [Halopseudomonas pachastrellae]|nr:GGDEF domain-containing protein [Halopseudomonas pachastrellae]
MGSILRQRDHPLLPVRDGRHRLRGALDRAASYDPLTGTCNRQMLQDRLKQGMRRALRSNQPLAVFCVDLDNFRHVNDSLGHSAGDAIICEVVDRLRAVLRNTDTIGRMGSDEFALVIEDYTSSSNLLQIAQKIINELAEPFTVSNEGLLMGCSVGIATYPEGGQTVDSLLLHANLAMLQAKGERGCSFHFYDERINLQAHSLIALSLRCVRPCAVTSLNCTTSRGSIWAVAALSALKD